MKMLLSILASVSLTYPHRVWLSQFHPLVIGLILTITLILQLTALVAFIIMVVFAAMFPFAVSEIMGNWWWLGLYGIHLIIGTIIAGFMFNKVQ